MLLTISERLEFVVYFILLLFFFFFLFFFLYAGQIVWCCEEPFWEAFMFFLATRDFKVVGPGPGRETT